jgi:hypothetical protein
LYQPGAPEDLYPLPDVRLKLAAAADTGRAQTWGKVLNPENLLFYTSTDPGTDANTDAWPAVADVDFPAVDLPTAPDDAGYAEGAPDATLPDPPAVLPGYEPFTLRLDTAGQAVNLVADRAKQAVEAVIENVALVRRSMEAAPAVTNQLHGLIQQLLDDGRKKTQEFEQGLLNLQPVLSLPDKFHALLSRLRVDVRDKIAELATGYKGLNTTAADLVRSMQDTIRSRWETGWDVSVTAARDHLRQVVAGQADRSALRAEFEQVRNALERQMRSAESVLTRIDQAARHTSDVFSRWHDELVGFRLGLEVELRRTLNSAFDNQGQAIQENLDRALALALRGLAELQRRLSAASSACPGCFAEAVAQAQLAMRGLINALLRLPTLVTEIDPHMTRVLDAIDSFARAVEDVASAKIGRTRAALADLSAGLDALVDGGASSVLKALAQDLMDAADIGEVLHEADLQVRGKVGAWLSDARDRLNDAALVAEVRTVVQEITDVGNEQIAVVLSRRANDALLMAGGAYDLVKQRVGESSGSVRLAYSEYLGAAGSVVARVFRPVERTVREKARDLDLSRPAKELEKLADRTLRPAVAHGRAFVAQQMKLNRDRLNYYFHRAAGQAREIADAIEFTPAMALVNRVGREIEHLDLKSLGIRLPSKSVLDRVLPHVPSLPKLDLRDILPDFAGINLSRLFEGVRFPSYGSDAVRVTHGVDPSTRRAFAQCDVDLTMSETIDLFAVGPLTVRLVRPRFAAQTRIEVGLSGGPQRTVNASLSGEFLVLVGGTVVFAIVDAVLRFDTSGHLKFEMRPSSIRLHDALSFLSDLMSVSPAQSTADGEPSGFTVETIRQNDLPTGARALLNLSLPAIQTGAFSISNIALRTFFEVAVAEPGGFYLSTGLALSSKERPFNMSVLCLGGGGWFSVAAMYRPFATGNRLAGTLSVGLAVGASLPFDIVVAKGGVYFLISAGLDWTFGSGAGTTLLLRVAVGGEVVVLGIVSVSILFALEAEYRKGGEMKCTGIFALKIRICCFFSITIKKGITFTLAGGGSGPTTLKRLATIDIRGVVEAYLDTFALN